MKLDEMAKILGTAALLFPGMSLSPQAIKAWHWVFRDDDAGRFGSAFIAACKQPGRKFFPVPGEVTEVMQGTAAGDTPEELWSLCLTLASRSLPWAEAEAKIAAQSEAAAAAARSVGWDRIRYADTETELPFIRKDFIAACSGAAKRDVARIGHNEAKQILGRIEGAIQKRIA